MKKLLILLLFSFLTIPFLSFSQGINLELNRVVTIDTLVSGNLSGSGNWTMYSEIYTVPENKVWKIQYMSPFTGIYINEAQISFIQYSGSNSYESTSAINQVIWLDSGDEIKFKFNGSWNGNGSSAYSYSYFISALEFNKE